jgi:hypothetical protein
MRVTSSCTQCTCDITCIILNLHNFQVIVSRDKPHEIMILMVDLPFIAVTGSVVEPERELLAGAGTVPVY